MVQVPPVATARPPASQLPASQPSASKVQFPPPPIEPLFERTKQEGDGVWRPYPQGEPPGSAVMYRTDLHPHDFRSFVFTIIIAIDGSKVELHLMAGTHEPQSKKVPQERRPGKITASHHDQLLAVFNGGFMQKHGNFGMRIGTDTYVEPQEKLCTVAAYPDGAIRIRSWSALADSEPEMRFYRQTPPCLIERGMLHERLPQHDASRSAWGGAADGKQEVRRTALGLDRTGQILLFGYGDWISSTRLAQAMKAAGAYDAAQLDINWSYTRFFPIDHSTKPPQLGESFVEKLKYSRPMYISQPASKDFFYLTRRP